MYNIKILFFVIFSILILSSIIYFIRKDNVETFSKNETIKLGNKVKNSTMNKNQLDKCINTSENLNDLEDITNIINNCNPDQDNIVSENYILPTYLSNLELIANDNKAKQEKLKEKSQSSKYNLSDIINYIDPSKGILTQDNINEDNIRKQKENEKQMENKKYGKSYNDKIDDSSDSSGDGYSSGDGSGDGGSSEDDFEDHSLDPDETKYETKDGVNLLSILGSALSKLFNSNIGKLFLKFLSMITKGNILKIMAKSAECAVESKLVGLKKGTCLIGEDRTCFWNRQILEANNNVRCQCGSDNSSMSWHNSLAEHEANYAKELATKNKCKIRSGFNGHTTTFTDPTTKKTYKFSENIAISGKYSSSANDKLKAGESAVNGWSSEGIGKYATKKDSSNYTTMNWNTNTLVGCGSEYCSDAENYITVCAYTNEEGDAGNTYSGLSKSNKNKKISENVNCENPIFLGL
jgi:hypothetical protein